MTQSALDPVTSQGESMVKEEAEKAINPDEDTQQMKTWWISAWSTNSSKRL
jgi:hypothetical protein